MKQQMTELLNELAGLVQRCKTTLEDAAYAEKQATLQAIGRTISELEGGSVPVSEELRRLKGQLTTELADYTGACEALAAAREALTRLGPALELEVGASARRTRRRTGVPGARERQATGPVTKPTALVLDGERIPIRTWLEVLTQT